MASRLLTPFIWLCIGSLALGGFVPPAAAQQKKPAKSQAEKTARGKVAGLVVNATTGNGIPGATVEIVGTGETTTTDADGAFTLELGAGEVELKVIASNFVEATRKVTVVAGDTFPVDILLTQQGATEVVVVQATSSNDEIAKLEERRSGTTVLDIVSRKDLSNDVAGDAAGVLQRVPGLSVVDNKFVYVRGLGDRYSNTVLNDAILPTPQPDRRVVPLDQIPSSLVQNIKVLKTFTPDQPGEFSGGLVKIETLEFPNKPSLTVSAGFSGNTVTTGQDYLTYPGDDLDWLGFGLRRRRFPSIIPNRPLRRGTGTTGFNTTELQRFGLAFENIWEPRVETARPNQSYGISGSLPVGEKWGFVGNLNYGNDIQTLNEVRNFFRAEQIGNQQVRVTPSARYDYDSSTNGVRLGMLGTATYKANQNNKFILKSFFNNDAQNETRQFQGFFDDRAAVIRNTRLRYILSRTNTNQISGDHVLSKLGNSILVWRVNYSRATYNEPDLREAVYERDEETRQFVFFEAGQSGFRMFNDMKENIREGSIDFSKFFFTPTVAANVKVGFFYNNRGRNFNARRVRFAVRGFQGIARDAQPEQLFAPVNITPTRLEISEDTRPTDFYTSRQELTAGYAMADVTIKKARIIGGVRFERSLQDVRTFELFATTPRPTIATLDNTDPLPGIGFVYSFTPNQSLRLGYSRTVNRPQFRELSPFEFTDVTGGRATLGNPRLVRSKITNYDARYEYFSKSGNSVSGSFFYKDLQNPIEQVVEPVANLRTSFRNAKAARNAGFEFEGRQNMGSLWSPLANLVIGGNYTFVDSTIELQNTDFQVLTSLSRPLAGQSRHLINATLDYAVPRYKTDFRLLYNYTGDRISDVGALGLPDIIERGLPTLDLFLVKRFGGEKNRFEVKFTGANLLNRLTRFKVGEEVFQAYRRGRTFGVGITYTIF